MTILGLELEAFIALAIIAVILIIMLIMIAKSPTRTQMYKSHVRHLTKTIQNPNTPDETRRQAVKDLIKASPDNFDKEDEEDEA